MAVPKNKSPHTTAPAILYVRLPPALAESLRRASERMFEPQSVIVRRFIRRGLEETDREPEAVAGAGR